MEIDITYGDEVVKQCFKCHETVLSNLNILLCSDSDCTMLWNEFQIFLYENFEFDNYSKVLLPEFQIKSLMTSKNYLISLDGNGNVHTTSLKFKNASQKNYKYSFQPREQGIVAGTLYNEENALCLKHESNSYFLRLHKINTEFTLIKNVILLFKEHLPYIKTNDKYILKVAACPEENDMKYLENIFTIENTNFREHYSIVIITFDKFSVYGCLYNPKLPEEHVTLVKLHTCPTEICNIQIVKQGEFIIEIGLKIGTLIILSLKDLKAPEMVHLNIVLHKFLIHNNSVYYTDGKTMWKAENISSKDIKFKQVFIKHVYDFAIHRDQIICTTFTNLIYKFAVDDERFYIKSKSVDEYCSAEELLHNTDYLNKIMEEVKKNETLIKTINKEKDYITALSISNRQDIMESIINFKAIVYQNYEDAITENTKVILTNDIAEYFDADSFFFLIKISSTSDHNFSDILSENFGDLWIHLTLATKTKILKTNSIKITNQLKKISFLIPLKSKMVDTIEMNVGMKIMVPIPGALDVKQKVWTVLYRKNVTLHSEHFIKFNLNSNRQKCLKKREESIEQLILQAAEKQHGNLFEFTDPSKEKIASKVWTMYVRLPDQYQEVFKKKEAYIKKLNSKKVNFFLTQLTSEEFLKSKSNLVYQIGDDKVTIAIHNDGFSSPLLKVSSENIKITLNLKNFLSDLLNCVFGCFEPGKVFVKQSTYSAVENLQKAIKKCMAESSEEIESLIEQFERNVIGILPI